MSSKIIVGFAIAASALVAPALSFAQSNAPLTRADVIADFVRYQQAGYNTSLAGKDPYYPANIQAAQAKIAAQNEQQVASQAVGGVAQDGRVSSSTQYGSKQPTCDGPIPFCNIYFGN
jgi:Domain of unknown function (DUF4148)